MRRERSLEGAYCTPSLPKRSGRVRTESERGQRKLVGRSGKRAVGSEDEREKRISSSTREGLVKAGK